MTAVVLIVGDMERAEFQDVRAALEGCQVVATPDARSALDWLGQLSQANGQPAPAAVVLVQARPGELAVADVDRLRRAAPLTPVLGLLGSWCDGEGRTAQQRPPLTRLAWHQWGASCRRDVARLLAHACPAWGLPLTATSEERLLSRADEPLSKGEGLVAISAASRESLDWLRSACSQAGYDTVSFDPSNGQPGHGPLAGIWASAGRNPWDSELRRYCEAVRPARVLAILDFPRAEDRDRAFVAGASAVLAQPLLLEDLFWELGRISSQDAVE